MLGCATNQEPLKPFSSPCTNRDRLLLATLQYIILYVNHGFMILIHTMHSAGELTLVDTV